MVIFDWIISLIIIVGIFVLALAVYGMFWMPSFVARLQAASFAVYLGAGLIVFAAMLAIGRDVAEHGSLVLLILLITSPISTHALARAAVKHNASAQQLGPEENNRKDVVDGKPHGSDPEHGLLE